VFVAVVIEGVPLDALVDQLGGTRGSIYKMLFDARHKLRAALLSGGYLVSEHEGT
jgi:RNA polymerase sigma-70 factor, ECF subfamily